MSDVPIKPGDYLYGVKVVDIGDLRVARGKARRERSSCTHRKMVYCNDERRVWCEDCESTVEPFDAFLALVERMDGHIKNLKRREQQVKDAEKFALRSRAAKVLDEVWRGRSVAPCCPHCSRGILPEDVVGGVARVGRQFELARRDRKEAPR